MGENRTNVSSRTAAAPNSKRRQWWIVGGIVLVVVVAAAWAGWSLMARDDSRIEVLRVSASPWPEKYSINKGTETRYEDFYAVMVGTSTVKNPTPEEDHCLIVVITGRASGSCAPKSEDAFVKITVGPASPEALRNKFPEGTNLRLTYNGEEVVAHEDKG